MTIKNQLAVRIDEKGRLTLPKEVRQALGINAGDILFLKYEPLEKQIYIARAINPFDKHSTNKIAN